MLKVANDNTPATERPRSLVPIIMPDIPTKYHGYNKVDTATDQYVMFDSSSAYKDVSQTTVPFIDAQPVAPQPASWLGGAGLYHKVREETTTGAENETSRSLKFHNNKEGPYKCLLLVGR